MDTQKAIELLPWYLNGTLGAEERGEVEQHLASSAECRQALEETRATARIFNARVPGETLVDHAWGDETPDFAREILAEHLEHSPRDAELFELVMQSKGALEWSEQSEEKQSLTSVPMRPGNDNSAVQRWRITAIAASLLCLIALTGWLSSGNRGGEVQARAGALTVDLAQTSVYRGEETLPRVTVGTVEVFLSFPLPRTEDGTPAYATDRAKRVRIVDANGAVVYQVEGPVPSHSFYNVTLPANAELEPGIHRVQFFEAGSTAAEPLASYPFRVVAP